MGLVNTPHKKLELFVHRQVFNFIRNWGLFPPGARLCVLASGGVDSMVLLHILHHLSDRMRFTLRVLHFNHNVSPVNDRMQACVVGTCAQLGLELTTLDLHFSTLANFEGSARKERKRLAEKHRAPGELLVTAHHLNDSWEWTLMQQFRQRDWKSSLGIPVVSGLFRRPLLCLSRNQIEAFAKTTGVNFVNDPSNTNTNYLRNFVRNKIIPEVQQAFPQALRFYVAQQLHLAKHAGLLFGQTRKTNLWTILKTSTSDGGPLWGLLSPGFERSSSMAIHEALGLEKIVLHFLRTHCRDGRSQFGLQIQKIENVIRNNSFGPLHFHGGVKLYHRSGVWMLRVGEHRTDCIRGHSIEIAREDLDPWARRVLRQRAFWRGFPGVFCCSDEIAKSIGRKNPGYGHGIGAKQGDAGRNKLYSDVPTLFAYLASRQGLRWVKQAPEALLNLHFL